MTKIISFILLVIDKIMAKLYPMPSTDSLKITIPTPQNEDVVDIPISVVKTPTEPISAPSSASKATLYNFALAIRDFEGLKLNPKTGKPDQNWRLNNPGNARWNPGGYMPMYGDVKKSSNGFAIFKSYELGWLYLMNMIKGQIHKRPNSTILEFMIRYAPPEENPTVAYSNYLGKRLGVDPNTFLVKNLV